MTLHKLTAGAGYRYLLRSIATGDCQHPGVDGAAAYYTVSGNPPGRWLGAGLGDLGGQSSDRAGAPPGMPAGTVVDELAMSRLFGHGCDPLTGAPLGRPYRTTTPVADRVAAAVAALPAGMDPAARARSVEAVTRVELGRDVPRAVAGFDLTFTVMKSVSTLWALADPATRRAVHAAHTAAVDAAMGLVQDRLLFTRTGAHGCRQERTRGAIAVGFDHWDSRAGDPNLHTHVVLANKVRGADGGWRSVDSRALHHGVVAVSEVYETFLVDALARALPVAWGWRPRGARRTPAFELVGIDDGMLTMFSRRASQIDAAMSVQVARFAATHGRGPNRIEIVRLRQQVARATRPAKHVRPLAELLASWRARATAVSGLTPQQLTAGVLTASHTRPVRACDVPAVVVEDLAQVVLAGVRERRSTWTGWNVLAEAARVTKALIAATPTDRLAVLDRVSAAVLARCVALDAPAVFTATGRYATPDGGSVFDRPGERTFTDQVILDAEHRLLTAALDTTAPTARVLDQALSIPGTGERLAADQQVAVRRLAGSGRRVDLLVGPAGSGKTTTLAGLRVAWERAHGRGSVIGLAPSQTAAANLAGALGIACENTAKWVHESTGPGAVQRGAVIDQLLAMRGTLSGARHLGRLRTIDTALSSLRREQDRWVLHPAQLVVIDEASLAGTLTLDTLASQASAAGAKLLLVGDHAQLSAVDAGGVFALLADRAGAARLDTLWRFTHPWEAAATTALRAGNVRVLEEYEDAGRVHAGPGESMLEAAYTAWAQDVAAGYEAILLAPDSASVSALNTRAHNDRVQDGLVTPGGITTSTGTTVGVGDRVVTRLNDRHLRTPTGFVRNGDLWDVHAVGPDGTLTLTPPTTDPRRRGGPDPSAAHRFVVLPAGYVAEHVDLAYATTTHRAQGITVDRAHVLAHAGMTRENLYVAMTRGRDANHVYVATDTPDADCDDLPDPHAAGDARDILAAIVATTGAEQSATATIAARQDEATSTRRLDPIRRTLFADAAHTRWTQHLTDLGVPGDVVTRIGRSPDAGRLFANLDRITLLTAHPHRVVASLLGEFHGHGDPAAALHRAALAWLASQVPDVADLPVVHDPAGLDEAGQALLAQVDQLIADRVQALGEAAPGAQRDRHGVLAAGPVDPDPDAAWLARLGAGVRPDLLAPVRTVTAEQPRLSAPPSR